MDHDRSTSIPVLRKYASFKDYPSWFRFVHARPHSTYVTALLALQCRFYLGLLEPYLYSARQCAPLLCHIVFASDSCIFQSASRPRAADAAQTAPFVRMSTNCWPTSSSWLHVLHRSVLTKLTNRQDLCQSLHLLGCMLRHFQSWSLKKVKMNAKWPFPKASTFQIQTR